MKKDASNVLAFSCPHLPFVDARYLGFLKDTQDKFGCGQVVCVGDLVDNHSISYHEHNPDSPNPKEEIRRAKKILSEKWFGAFSELKICKGNHDILAARKAITYGLASEFIRSFEEIYDLPKGWDYAWNHNICGVRYEHGEGYGGGRPHMVAAVKNRRRTVIGHWHSKLEVGYDTNDKDSIWGMVVGCGIDRMNPAFWYGRAFKDKPVLACGVVLDAGRMAFPVPMKI